MQAFDYHFVGRNSFLTQVTYFSLHFSVDIHGIVQQQPANNHQLAQTNITLYGMMDKRFDHAKKPNK